MVALFLLLAPMAVLGNDAYKFWDGMYCTTYNAYGNSCQAASVAEATQKCDADTECVGVAKWDCSTECFRLCGRDKFGLSSNYGDTQCTYVKKSEIPTPPAAENWKRTEDMHCGGSTLNTWNDGSNANYGATGKTIAECQALCDAHQPECKGFVFKLFDNACFWKTGTFALHASPVHDCYERNVPAPPSVDHGPYKMYSGLYCTTYNTWGNACQATSYADGKQKCDAEPLCLGVAQWGGCTGNCWRLCGKNRGDVKFDVVPSFGSGRCTYAKPIPELTPTPAENWTRTEDTHCGGTNINTWNDGSNANYGAAGKTVAECQALCEDHQPECKGFVFRLYQNKCFWKSGTFAPHAALAHDCYEYNPPTPTPVAAAANTPAPVAGPGDAAECAGKTNLSPGVYIRLNKPKLEQKTKLVDDNADPICECHDLCKEKSADAFMYYTKGKKKPKALCKCYMGIAAANEDGKLKLQMGGKRTSGKYTGWITDAGKNLISKDMAKDTKRRIKERKQSKKRRRGRRN